MPLTDEQLKALGLGSDQPPDVPLPASPAPSILGQTAQPQYPRSIMGNKIPQGAQIPTGPDAHAQGKEEYQEFMPQITASPGTTDYFRQRQEQLDYKSQHPWGDPISAHPGVLGKILHGLSVAGNIAGNAVEPGIMSMIPGTSLNRAAQSAGNEKGILAGEQKDIEQEQADTAQAGEKSKEGLESAEEKNLESETAARNAPPPKDTFEKLQDGSIVQLTTDPHTGNSSVKLLYKGDGKTETDVIQRQVGNEAHNILINKKTGEDIRDLGVKKEETPGGTFSIQEDAQGHPVLFNSKTGQMQAAPAGLEKSGTALKANKPYQDALDAYGEAQEYAKTPSPTNDFGLLMSFVGMTKPESVGKLRFNQAELKTVLGTRSSLGDLEALGNKVANGQMLTPQQRQDMLNTMKIVADHAQKKLSSGEGATGGTKKDSLGIR